MGLETGSFISDLIATNPPSTDKKSQGDDHLRLIKAVLQGSFPSSSKAFYNPAAAAKTINFTVVAADMNKTFLIDTTAGTMTGTLPTLTSGDAGWQCHFLKTNTGPNAFWIAPASGTLQSDDLTGLAKTRRVIPGVRSTALWTGSTWVISRAVNVPVGSIIDFDGTTLPVGYEWPNGQTLSGSSGSVYPDYFARKGSLATRDLRGKSSFGRDDMGGSAAGLITNALSGVVGAALGATGGLEAGTLAQSALPNVSCTFAGTTINLGALSLSSGVAGRNGNTGAFGSGGGGFVFTTDLTPTVTIPPFTPAGTISSLNGGVTQTVVVRLPPMMILNKILVVE